MRRHNIEKRYLANNLPNADKYHCHGRGWWCIELQLVIVCVVVPQKYLTYFYYFCKGDIMST